MTAPVRHLRVAGGAAPPPTTRLELVPALRARGARLGGVVLPGRSEAIVHELRLPGIGGRYLAGVADHLEAAGWCADERAAVIAALEQRSVMWITCAPGPALRRAGLGRPRTTALRTATLRYAAGRWTSDRAPGEDGIAGLVGAGLARGAVCAAAGSGAEASAALVAAAARSGARTARLGGGLSGELGARWAFELLIAPALPAGSLVSLREHVAAASRCGWCRVPVLGTGCTRCSPLGG